MNEASSILVIGAQAFYASHDFVVVERGFAELADNPWATDRDALADLKFEWLPKPEREFASSSQALGK